MKIFIYCLFLYTLNNIIVTDKGNKKLAAKKNKKQKKGTSQRRLQNQRT